MEYLLQFAPPLPFGTIGEGRDPWNEQAYAGVDPIGDLTSAIDGTVYDFVALAQHVWEPVLKGMR